MRTILHCDCNGFFASVETLLEDNPNLDPAQLTIGERILVRKKEIGTATDSQNEEQMQQYADQVSEGQMRDQLLNALVAECEDLEITDELVEAELDDAVKTVYQQLQLSFLQFHETLGDIQPQAAAFRISGGIAPDKPLQQFIRMDIQLLGRNVFQGDQHLAFSLGDVNIQPGARKGIFYGVA